MKTKNTSKEEMHPEWLMGRNPKAIENQEAEGQLSFCNSVDLPVNGRHFSDGILEAEQLKKMGIRLGNPYKDDPIFRPVELPEGWQKVPTDHSMHSNLIDDKGRVRAEIFYKAAFYDRQAHISIKSRFSYKQNDNVYPTHIQHQVFNCETLIFSCEPILNSNKEKYYEICDSQIEECKNWLKENYPKWEDPIEYWD